MEKVMGTGKVPTTEEKRKGESKVTINYIKLINWIWQTVPHIEGYKAAYMTLFFAIIDSINRNTWHTVALPYDYLTNKCGIDKTVYLAGRKWLIDNQLLDIKFGKNNYQMATFNLGMAVDYSTGIDTGITTGGDTCTPTDITSSTGPHSKTVNGKPKKDKPKTLNVVFEKFFDLYKQYKNTGEGVCKTLWKNLTDDERTKVIDHLPKYLESENQRFLKTPKNYLAEKHFNCQISIGKTSNHSQVLKENKNEDEYAPFTAA